MSVNEAVLKETLEGRKKITRRGLLSGEKKLKHLI